jgi:hypothetical protein
MDYETFRNVYLFGSMRTQTGPGRLTVAPRRQEPA